MAEVAIGHLDASSRMFQASLAWSSVVAICGVGISPNSVSCSQRSVFDVCFVADGFEVQVVTSSAGSLAVIGVDGKTK